jgi:hypothetical protein
LEKSAILLILILFSLVFGTQLTTFASAIYLPIIRIENDGSIQPETSFIHRNGNVYTLTSNLTEKYAIVVRCSNIVFDGAGHTLYDEFSESIMGYQNVGLKLENVNNVTIRDLALSGFGYTQIEMDNCSGCSFLRVNASINLIQAKLTDFSQCNLAVGMIDSESNLINKCNLSSLYMRNSSAKIFENNILRTPKNFYSNVSWDNGSVGNYWIDYFVTYPNASETGNTGMGNTPYLMDPYNIDHHPLTVPFDILRESQPKQEQSPIIIIACLSAVLIVSLGIVLFIHFKRKIKQ